MEGTWRPGDGLAGAAHSSGGRMRETGEGESQGCLERKADMPGVRLARERLGMRAGSVSRTSPPPRPCLQVLLSPMKGRGKGG